jgi:ATP sulfurylase
MFRDYCEKTYPKTQMSDMKPKIPRCPHRELAIDVVNGDMVVYCTKCDACVPLDDCPSESKRAVRLDFLRALRNQRRTEPPPKAPRIQMAQQAVTLYNTIEALMKQFERENAGRKRKGRK